MKRLRLWAVVATAASILLLASSVFLWVQRNDFKGAFEQEKEANSALFSNAGRMCSVISSAEAAKLLESEVAVDAAAYPSGFVPAVEDSDYLPLIDSCRYSGTKNNTRYLNIVGSRYRSVEEARADFETQRSRLQNTEPLDAQAYQADEAFYYGSAIYVRKAERIVSYSINKPEVDTSQQRSFTEKNFSAIYTAALSLL